MTKKRIAWNKGMKRGDHPSLKEMGFKKGKKNPMKKKEVREKVSRILKKRCKRRTIYDIRTTSLIHRQVERVLGKPKICENCGDTTKNKYDWANISGLYKDDITDYIRLCISCHRLYDFGKIKVRRNFKI